MSGQSYNLSYNIDVKASIGSLRTLAKEIQSELDKIRLPLASNKSFNSQLATISKELNEIDRISQKTSLTIGDVQQADKHWDNLSAAIGRIKVAFKDLGVDGAGAEQAINRLIDPSVINKFKQLEEAAKKSEQALSGISDTKASKDLQKQLEDAKAKKKAFEEQVKASKLLAKESKLLNMHDLFQQDSRTGSLDEKGLERLIDLYKDLNAARQKVSDIKKGKNDFSSEQEFNKQLEEALKKRDDILQKLQGKQFNLFGQGQGKNSQDESFLRQLESYFSQIDKVKELQDKLNKHNTAISNAGKVASEIEQIDQSLRKLGEANSAKTLDDLAKTVAQLTGQDANQLPRDFKQLQEIINNFKVTNFQDAVKVVEQLKTLINGTITESDKLGKSMENTGEDAQKMLAASKDVDQLKSRLQYFFSLTGITHTLQRAFRDVTNTIKELDSVMTETAVVTDFEISDMWDKLPEYTEQASKLGTSIKSLYEATTLYYQQGLGDQAAMDLGVETMKMARIANMDAADATKAMTAALRGFNMEINETSATRINDVYSELAAITAADTNQIATAMSKTASIASSANMEFETTAAFLAQIIETTQEAPETAGTAMKTIIARFTEVKKLFSEGMLTGKDEEGEAIEINKIDKALQSVGISLKDFLLGKKGIDDIFLELASKWGTLDLATQRYIATTAAGSRQQSRFIAMMSDYGRTMELVNAAQNSGGASQEQFDKTLDSLSSKMERLKNAWHEFTMGIIDSDLIKGGIDLLTKFLETINKVTDALGKAGPLARIGLIAGGFKMGRGLFNKSGAGSMVQAAGSILRSKAGLPGKEVTQTLGQTLTSKAMQSFSNSSWAQKYLVADSVLGKAWNKIYKPNTGANAAKENPYYQKAVDYINRRKELKQQKGVLEQEIFSGKKKFASMSVRNLGFSGRELDIDEERNPNKEQRQKFQKLVKNRVKQQKTIREKEAQLSDINKELNIPKQKLETFGKGGGYMAGAGLLAMIGGDAAEGAGHKRGDNAMEAIGTGFKSAGATAAALGTLSGALAAFGMAIPGANVIIAATAALVGLYKGLEKIVYLKSDEHALEVAEANKKVADQTAQKEQERVQAMNSLTDDLQGKYENIDKMTKGSSEWKKAVAELNKEIADTITQVPELAGAFSMKDGVLRADQTKITEITRIVETQAQQAETNVTIADYEQTVAENNLTASDLYDQMFGTAATEKWKSDESKRATLEKMLNAYNQGYLNDMADILAFTGSSSKGLEYNQVVAGLMQYSGIKAQSEVAKSSLNQSMVSSALETGTLSENQAEMISGLSESFLGEIYDDSRSAAKEGLDDWSYGERRDARREYASENGLKYRRGIWGLWSSYVDENGNKVDVTDEQVRYDELGRATQKEYGTQVQKTAEILNNNPLLARAMSAGGGQLEQNDLDQMSKMFGTTESGDLVFDAKKFAESLGFDNAEQLAKEMGFEGKEGEFFGQIAKNFQSRVEDGLSTAIDNVQMANALNLSENAVKAFSTEELQAQANDFYSLMQMRGMDADAMRAGMEVFADLAESGDTHGMEQLSEALNEINFDNPIEAFGELERMAERGSYAERQYANAIKQSGSQMIGTGAQLQHFLKSEDFDSVWEELEGIIELNGTIEPDNILDLADNHEVLNKLMKQTNISAVGLGKAIEMVGEGMTSAEAMTDAVVAALSAMGSLDEEIARGLKDAANFDAGLDENQAAGFISQAYETLNANIEKGAWGNSQNAAYLDELFGDSWHDSDANVQASNMAELTKFLGKNVENMSDAWRRAAKGETLGGGNAKVLEDLGLSLDPSTGEVRMGGQVTEMSSEQIVATLSEGFGVSEQMARLMLADFKNYSKDFDLLLGIAKNDEKEGAERFKEQINRREDVVGRDGKVRKAVDEAELQAAALAYGYKDTSEKTAGQQYAEEHGITTQNGYLITDFFYEDGTRKGGSDLVRAMGAAYLGQGVSTTKGLGEQDYAIASDYYKNFGTQQVTGTWDEYIDAGYGLGQAEGDERRAQAEAAMARAQENVDLGVGALSGYYNGEGHELSWQQYIDMKGGDRSEYSAWLAEQTAIARGESGVPSWQQEVTGFDYEGMTDMIESLGATSDEAAMIAQSQIDAQLEATGRQSTNLKMWSYVLGKEVDIEHQKGQNIQQEFQAAEAQEAKQQQQIATLREALGMEEGGTLKVAIKGITDGENTLVTFDPDTTAVDAARAEMAKPIDVQVSFSGSGSVTATGSAGGTFTVQLAAHASGIVDAPNTHDALLGEKGPELVQTKNGAWIAGLNGPEVGTIHKGDTVYTAEETKRIFNPKKNLMPRFEGGTGNTGPGGYGGVTGSGGKSTSNKNKEWENPFDKLYNLLRKIDEELRERERIERRYEKLLEDIGVSADKIINISREELAQLEKERQYQEQLVSGRKDQIAAYQKENSQLLQYASVTQNERGEDILRIDWEAIDAITDKEKGSEVEAYVNQLEEWFDSLTEAEDALWEIEDLVAEIKERGRDEYFDLEEAVKDAIEKSYQDQIDELEKINDSINDTNAELLEGIQKTISKQRQDRENEKTEEDLADKQRRLSYLQMDTSGANAVEILKLQKEIEEGQENYTDTLIDQKISELQEQNDEAAKQREKQIDLLQAQLDHYLESGRIWEQVNELMATGVDAVIGLIPGSELEQLLQNEAGFKGMSAIGKMEWMNETNNMIAQALAYLELGRQLEDIGVKAGTKIEFVTADGQKLTGTVDKDGVVTTANGKKYDNVYQTYDGTFRAGENIVPVEVEEPEGNPNSGKGSGSGTGSGTGTGSGEYRVYYADYNGTRYYGNTEGEAVRLATAARNQDASAAANAAMQKGGSKPWEEDVTKISSRPITKGSYLVPYETGGLADFTGPAWLDGTKSRPELVLNQRDTQNFIQLKDILSSILSNNLGNSISTENNGDTTYDIDINVESIGSDYDVDKVASRVKTLITEDARYRNNNAVSLKR